MERKNGYGGIDRFRLVAALLIVGIHTFPFTSISEELNFLVIHVFARIAVPFFLMATGYFLLPRYLIDNSGDTKPLVGFIKKTGLIYAAATLIYLPVSIYAGYYSEGNVFAVAIRNILFDGTFYHLWYLPASIIGVLLLYFLGRRFSFRAISILAAVLYLIGLLGDSYYGVVARIPFLHSIYNAGFNIFSYTRNGLFYAPVFLVLGAVIAKKERRISLLRTSEEGVSFASDSGARMRSGAQYRQDVYSERKGSKKTSFERTGLIALIGFAVSMALMLIEGAVLNRYDYQLHDSMYIMLVPSMYFLFSFLLTLKSSASPTLRNISMWIYVVHPLCIVVIRGAARVTGLTNLLVENSITHYIAVCISSIIVSYICASILKWQSKS